MTQLPDVIESHLIFYEIIKVNEPCLIAG